MSASLTDINKQIIYGPAAKCKSAARKAAKCGGLLKISQADPEAA
jgi:hypothetical protein